ncbi:hypothetical protein JCM3765_006908, partial [Sporobolomyces pararoseus]
MNELAEEQKPSIEPSTSPRAVIKQEELADSLPTIPHLESTSTLALHLPEPQKQIQSIKKNGNTPCEYCRKVRRACKWVENFQVCERCLKSGRVCTGPTRRTESSFELARSTPRKQLASASIGPSSPESRWSSLHLSYSLTYHLIETGLPCLDGDRIFAGFDCKAFIDRFRGSQGRLEQPDSIDEAIVLSAPIIPTLFELDVKKVELETLVAVGFSRRDAILAVARRILDRAEAIQLSRYDQTKAAEQVSVWLFATKEMFDLEETSTERLHLLRTVIDRALKYYLLLHQRHETVAEVFLEPLRELVTDEVRFSLLVGKLSTISLSTYQTLFPRQSRPLLLKIPEDFSFVFSSAPEPPETRKFALDWQDSLRDFASQVYRHLDYLLAYAPQQKIEDAMNHCWSWIEAVLLRIATCFDRIVLDSRCNLQNLQPRPTNILINLIHDEFDSFFTLRSCHVLIEQRFVSSKMMLRKSTKLWYEALTRSAHRLSLMPILDPDQIGAFVTSSYFVERLRLCPGHVLMEWAHSNPSDAARMIEGLRL